jgi:hypothetical protein
MNYRPELAVPWSLTKASRGAAAMSAAKEYVSPIKGYEVILPMTVLWCLSEWISA